MSNSINLALITQEIRFIVLPEGVYSTTIPVAILTRIFFAHCIAHVT